MRNCTFRQQIASIKQKASGQNHRRLFAALLCDPGDGEEIHPSTQESPKEPTASLRSRQAPTLLHSAGSLTCVSSQVCLEMRTLGIGFATACIVTSVGGCFFWGHNLLPLFGLGSSSAGFLTRKICCFGSQGTTLFVRLPDDLFCVH